MAIKSTLIFLILQGCIARIEARQLCEGGGHADDYWCDVGHCCGDGECCTYYYELWWFWLVWFVIVFVIGFCVWQRKRLRPWRDHHYSNRCGLCGPPDLYPDILPIPPVKLPTYAEIGDTPSFNTPPPPYTCECFITVGGLGSFDQPPPEAGAPPVYFQYSQIIAPLLPRLQPNTSTGTQYNTSTGTQFPEGSPSTTITVSNEVTPTATESVSSVLTPESPCLSCSSSSSPLTTNRSCSCSSVQSGPSVHARNGPGHAVSARLVSEQYVKPLTWLSHSSFGKVDNVGSHFQYGSRLHVPYRAGANFNPCPRCVSRSVSSLRQCSPPSVMRDASTSTLQHIDPPPSHAASRNQEPERFERRNSYSLPRNFVCSTKPKD